MFECQAEVLKFFFVIVVVLQLVLEPRGVTGRCPCGRWQSVVAVAVCAQNLTAVGEKAGADQRDGAARTLKARLVPLPVLERNIFPVSKPCETQHKGNKLENVFLLSLETRI